MLVRGGASLTASVDETIEIPVGGSAGFTWSANSPDGTKHVVGKAPIQLGTVSFTLGGAEPIAFAVYSDDDKSLDFYKRLDVPEVDDTFEGKTVTKVYTGIETDTYASETDVPWADHKADIVKVKVVDRIQPVSMAHWFNMTNVENPKVTEVDFSNVSTGVCKSMSCLFRKAKSLKRIDGLQNWDTSKVSDLSYIFSHCLSLESLDVSYWDTSKVTTFRAMFATSGNQRMKLRTVGDLSDWSTSNATDMSMMFQNCERLESIGNISGWDTSKVTDMSWLFFRCVRLNGIGGLSGWDTSNCTTMLGMFCHCLSLESLDVSRWDTSKVTTFRGMFSTSGNQYMKLRTVGDLSGWNTSNVTNMAVMFQDCEYLENIGDISEWNTSNVTNMNGMFWKCLSLESLDVSRWDTSKVTTFRGMFAGYGNQYMKLKSVGDLSGWNTSNVTDMTAMFQDCQLPRP